MKKLFTMLTVVCALFAGCSSDDTEDRPSKPELTISSDDASVSVDADALGATVSADAAGLTATLGIATNCDAWTLDTPPSWIETDGAANSLKVTILKNEKVDARSATLTISVENKAGKLDAKIRIAQTGVAAATLHLDQNALTIPAAGGSSSLTYTTNQTTVRVEKSVEWLTFSQEEGKITFSSDANATADLRTAEVVLVAGAGDNTAAEKVVISQEMYATLSLSAKNVTIPAAGGRANITYATNQPSVALEKTAEWLTCTQGEGTIEFSSGINDTGAPRTSEVVITAGSGANAATQTVIVKQDPYVKSLVYVIKTGTDQKQAALPALTSTDAAISISVDYGDGTTETFTESLTSAVKHTYATAGEYTVTITTDNVISAWMFYQNTDLYKITNNSLDMSGVTTLSKCFYNDTNLTEVAVNTISPCVNTTNLEHLFYGCKALAAIPAGLLNGLDKIKSVNNMFQNCSSLRSVPEGFFAGMTGITAFRNTFVGAGITQVPSRLFAGCSAVTQFNYTFNKCKQLTTIAADAFDGCNAVKEFYATFTECTSLTEIPEALFAQMTALEDLEYCFQMCSALTTLPATLFDNNRSLKYLDYCFMDCTLLSGESPYTVIDGSKIHLYERKNYPDDFLSPSSYEGCFRNNELMTDYPAMMQNGWAN